MSDRCFALCNITEINYPVGCRSVIFKIQNAYVNE
jgi:hypothetical protein